MVAGPRSQLSCLFQKGLLELSKPFVFGFKDMTWIIEGGIVRPRPGSCVHSLRESGSSLGFELVKRVARSGFRSQASWFSNVKDDVSWIALCKVRYRGQRMA
jgi:hypothetical protein